MVTFVRFRVPALRIAIPPPLPPRPARAMTAAARENNFHRDRPVPAVLPLIVLLTKFAGVPLTAIPPPRPPFPPGPPLPAKLPLPPIPGRVRAERARCKCQGAIAKNFRLHRHHWSHSPPDSDLARFFRLPPRGVVADTA